MQEKNLTIISIIFFAIILILSFILIITISFETQLIENNNKINSNLINSNQKNLLSLQENNEIFFDKPYFKQVFFEDPGYVICDDGWPCMGECIPAPSYCDLSGGCQSYGSGTVCSDWSDPGDCDPNNNACVPASCEGNCGGLAGGIGGACFCDEVCTGYGDCCPDYEDFCTHQECNPDNFTCELIKEPGDDTCSEDTNCFHHECNSISLTCEKKAGPGEDTCETPEDCYEICNVDNEKCKIGDCNPIKVCEGCDCVEDPNQTVCSGKTFGNECEDSGYCQSINSHSEYYCDVTGACVYYGSTCDSDYHSECNPSDNTCEAFSCKDNCYGWYEDYAGYYCECNDWCTDWGVCCPGYIQECCENICESGTPGQPGYINACYDPSLTGCCDGKVYSLEDEACCGGKIIFNTKTHFCCESIGPDDLPNVYFKAEYSSCCGTTACVFGQECCGGADYPPRAQPLCYDPTKYICCNTKPLKLYDPGYFKYFLCMSNFGPFGKAECCSDRCCYPTHNICNLDGQCVAVDGIGANTCKGNLDCAGTYSDCKNNKCVVKKGNSEDKCGGDEDCKTHHFVCDDGTCKKVNGPGANTCNNNNNCKKEYSKCENQQCVIVEGKGVNSCIMDADCKITHRTCNQKKECITVEGVGVNTCNNNNNCQDDDPTHTECANNQCIVVDGEGDNSCNNDTDCKKEYRTCDNQQCIIIEGEGINSCNQNTDCKNEYRTCTTENQCIVIEGIGINTCNNNDDCEDDEQDHTECANNQCIVVDGEGDNSCSNDNDCKKTYRACDNQQCIIIEGEGTNTCNKDNDCKTTNPPITPQPTYRNCNNKNQCVLIEGTGTNYCNIDFDCKNFSLPTCGNGIIDEGEECGELGLSCNTGKKCVDCICIPIGTKNSIIELTAKATTTTITGNIFCKFSTIANLKLFDSTNKLLTDKNVTCSKDTTYEIIQNLELNKNYIIKAIIPQPCERCNKEKTFLIKTENETGTVIPDNNISIIIILLLTTIIFSIKKENTNNILKQIK